MVKVFTCGKLLADFAIKSFFSLKTSNTLFVYGIAFKTDTIFFVLISLNLIVSKTIILLDFALEDKAEHNANLLSFLFIAFVKFTIFLGPKATQPQILIGDLFPQALACHVHFCLNIFLVDHLTSPLVLVCAITCLALDN